MTNKPIKPKPKNKNVNHRMLPRPSEIKEYLDQHVIGQEKAKICQRSSISCCA